MMKDFPMTGDTDLRFVEAQKRVWNGSVKPVQHHRRFDFISPREGAQNVLPGDGKAKA